MSAELSRQSSGDGLATAERIHRELRRAPRGGLTRGELAILLIDLDDDEVIDALEAEIDADRVVSGVSGPAMLVRYYLAGGLDG